MYSIFFGIGLLLVGSLAVAQHELDDGGDPVMMIFDSARVNATGVVETLVLPDSHISADIGEWFEARRVTFADRIRSAVFEWSTQSETTCARTNIQNADPHLIRLSLPLCRAAVLLPGYGEAEAIKTLLHEISHQLGVQGDTAGEEFATRLSNQIHDAWRIQRERRAPFWAELARAGDVPEERAEHVSLVVGGVHESKLFIWGGCNRTFLPDRQQCAAFLGNGSVYSFSPADPRSGRWRAVPLAPLAPRKGAAAARVGERQVLIAGGCSGQSASCTTVWSDALLFDLEAMQWSALPAMHSARVYHSAVSTDSGAIVWGGLASVDSAPGDQHPLNSGEIWDAGQWTTLTPPADWNFAGRFGHFATWTGSHMLVWGGCAQSHLGGRCARPLSDGFLYRPATADAPEVWTRIDAPSGFTDREQPAVTWTGRYLIIWGGKYGSSVFRDGAMYDAEVGSWQRLSDILPGESGRFAHKAIWDGTRQRVLFWGGQVTTQLTTPVAAGFASHLIALEFGRDGSHAWRNITLDNAPPSAVSHSLHGSFDTAVSWGGFSSTGRFTNAGYVFFP